MNLFYRQILLLALCASSLLTHGQEKQTGYVCYKSASSIRVDGLLSKKEWGNVPWTDYFVDIEGDKKPIPKYKTRAKMLWDDKYFYVAAEIKEPHIWGKLTKRDAVIFHDNDFEVFIDPQGDNHLYYEFEMNALNTVWDLLLAKPYRDGAPAINGWHIYGLKSAVKIYGSLNDPTDKDNKWTVEIAFPWSVLKECAPRGRKPEAGDKWRVNFSRVNWDMDIKDGKYIKPINPKTGKHYPEYNWVWAPQGVIAMHQPETWGYVQFSEITAGKGIESFVPDKDYELKRSLISIYYAQKKYFKNHKRYFLSSSKVKEINRYSVKIETTSKQFIAYAKGPSGKVWYINEKSRIWTE